MYRIVKVLNNNGLLTLDEANREIILLGKGIGFCKKNGERIDHIDDAKIYELVSRNNISALQMVNGIAPAYIEITARIIDEAELQFEKINHDIFLPMADHIALAVKRANEGKELPNPFHQDIMVMFPDEYKVAEKGRQIIKEISGTTISEDEAGYITLHIHAGLSDENVSEGLNTARLVKKTIGTIEFELKKTFVKNSLGYNRLVSHIRYMVARIIKDERVNIDMESYAKQSFPEAYTLAQAICEDLAQELGRHVAQEEIGLLGMHIQRVL